MQSSDLELRDRPTVRSCYLCGAQERLTRDHIPPRNLFPQPRPTNLITVDCCEVCNNGMNLSDERKSCA
jgi:hypothetical protein